MIHTVRRGDTLYKIANNYGVTINDIAVANGLNDVDRLAIGENLLIPTNKPSEYIVKSGDTLYKIARNYQIPLQLLVNANPDISDPNRIMVGDIINIPSTKREIEVNGYAIANISNTTLDRVLPDLTYLSIFSYQVKADGDLYILYENQLINKSLGSNVAPLMVLTNISAEGGFDSNITKSILNNTQIRDNLISDIISTISVKKYRGINIDFEYIYLEDRDRYTEFLRELKSQMNSLDPSLLLTVAVAPKYRDTQSGILYEGHDYRGIGDVADRVIIMTYEWGYMYGEPMAVSPIREMSAVLSYAITRIPPEKILMGLPNYAYDWTLPFNNGDSARALSNTRALEQALDRGTSIMYDTNSETPYYNYQDDSGKTHVVWFDDARSMTAKLDLVSRYNLAGISIWTVNNYWAPLFSSLNESFNVKKVL